jgi:hypothetical protein
LSSGTRSLQHGLYCLLCRALQIRTGVRLFGIPE